MAQWIKHILAVALKKKETTTEKAMHPRFAAFIIGAAAQ